MISVPEVGPRDAIPYEIQGGGTAADIESLIVSYEELKHDLSECNDALKEHRKEIVAAQRDIEQLQKEIETLKRQSGQREGEHRGTTYQDNINLLSALSNKEVTCSKIMTSIIIRMGPLLQKGTFKAYFVL